MSVAYVQHNNAFTDGPVALTSVGAGNALCCIVFGTTTLASTSLPAGWQKQTQVTNSGFFACWWVYPDHPGGTVSDTITSFPSACSWAVLELSGADSTSPVEDYVTNTGTGTTWSLANIDVSEGAAIVCATGQPNVTFTITETVVGLTARHHEEFGVHSSFTGDNKTAGAYSPSGAVAGSSQPWIAAGFGLKAGAPSPVTFGAVGAKTITGTTTVSIAHPAGTAADQVLLAGRVGWYSDTALSDESGWTNTIRQAGGNNGAVADNHTTEVGVDRKEITGADAGPTVFDQVGGTSPGIVGLMARYTKLAGYTWDFATSAGTDDTHGADRSVTGSSSIALAVDDVVTAWVAVGTDASLTITSPAITASGITFGTTAARAPVSAGSIQGHDGNIYMFDAKVTAGSGTVAPVLNFTTATSQSGPVGFVRLRAVAPAVIAPTVPTMATRRLAGRRRY